MPKMIPPQGLKEVAIQTPRGTKLYRAGRDGLINVDNPRDAKQMKQEGLGEASLFGVATGNTGYQCSNCGFGSWFKVCSRCGTTNEKIGADGSSG